MSGRLRLSAGVVAVLAASLGPWAPHPVSASLSCPSGTSASATVSPPGGSAFTICSGLVPSFDGTPLDVDVSIPTSATGPLPLMVMLHGWGNSKTDFESTTLAGNGTYSYDWNNAWFVSKGWAVLNYTARGFHQSCGKENGMPIYLNEAGCSGPASWTHLADRRWEVRDTQYLAGKLVDAGISTSTGIAVTGDSYGGGQSWLLSLSQNKVMDSAGNLSAWTSPNGTALSLKAAVPLFTWTDLTQALVDNGNASDGLWGAPADGNHTSPLGVEKQSYVAGLYALGTQSAQFATPQLDPTADLTSWFAGLAAGEPYEANPLLPAALAQISQFRSPFSMQVPPAANAIPVLNIQGLTDPLFPGIQNVQMANKLLAANASYPLWSIFGDLGHAYAANPPALWQTIAGNANTWLSSIMAGTTPALAHDSAATVQCLAGQTTVWSTATTFGGLATKTIAFSSNGVPGQTTSATGGGTEATTADPIVNGGLPGTTGGCRTMSFTSDPGVASWFFPLPTSTPSATLMGAPYVHVDVTLAGANAELAMRLWDWDTKAGTQTLITRNVVRLLGTPGSVIPVDAELWPTAWQLQSGHELRLDLTQLDTPTWRPDNLPSALLLQNLSLTTPVS